jgi:hypothetical protein
VFSIVSGQRSRGKWLQSGVFYKFPLVPALRFLYAGAILRLGFIGKTRDRKYKLPLWRFIFGPNLRYASRATNS